MQVECMDFSVRKSCRKNSVLMKNFPYRNRRKEKVKLFFKILVSILLPAQKLDVCKIYIKYITNDWSNYV